MTKAFVFPGQGSQFIGMGKELADNFSSAKEVFSEVNEALHQDLFKLMVEGPEHELTLTANTQPALMAHSMAVVRILEKDFKRQYNHPKPKHSDVLGVIAKHSKQKEINTYSEFDRCFDYESISAELRRFNIFLTGSQIRSYKTVGTLLSNFTR